jgi:hypothetical protein
LNKKVLRKILSVVGQEISDKNDNDIILKNGKEFIHGQMKLFFHYSINCDALPRKMLYKLIIKYCLLAIFLEEQDEPSTT